MSKFLKVKTAEEVLQILRSFPPLEVETVGLDSACGRVLAAPIVAPEPVPHFPRAVMDGYAVRSRDTYGASETLPALLEISGEVSMGGGDEMVVEAGKAVGIPTGGMLPTGADAVVMVEYTHAVGDGTVEVARPVAPGDNVLEKGEDISLGEELFSKGWKLRPQDVGVAAALGITSALVRRRPRVAVLSTGDEIVPVATPRIDPGKIRDINTWTLAAQIREAGAEIGMRRLIGDDLELLSQTCREAATDHDVLILSGGSSVGARDYTLNVLERFPEAELLVHGVAMRPGKPTILGRIGTKLFWGLPGQPVSALMICRAFVVPSLLWIQGLRPESSATESGVRRAELQRRIPSVHGRTDYVPVTLSSEGGRLLATPVFGKSAMIGVLARANGYVVIPEHVEGLERGTETAVHLFSPG